MQNYKKMKRRFFNGVRQVLITSLGKSSAQNAHSMQAHTKTQKHTHTQRGFAHIYVYIQDKKKNPGDLA